MRLPLGAGEPGGHAVRTVVLDGRTRYLLRAKRAAVARDDRRPLLVVHNGRDDMAKFGVGQPVRRVEDQRLITGAGRYSDDINLDGQAYGYVLRSPHAHAKIRGLDTSA